MRYINKKLLVVALFIAFCGVLACACGSEPEQIDISSVAEIKTADGVSYACAEVDSDVAKDETNLNAWYTDYYKDLRDSGEIVSLVVRYADDPEHATLFTGINVYTGCEVDADDNASFKTFEKWYRTESDRDRVLFEQDADE